MICKGLHHAAYRCNDAKETVEFYTKVVGLKFVHAMGEDHVPSTGKYSPHIHIFFQMEDGSCIAFFECPNDEGDKSGRDPNTPDWIQHFAMRVENMEILLDAKKRLEEMGIDVVGPTNHDDFLHSIYFFDPSGHRLELSVDSSTLEQNAQFQKEAMDVLELWSQTRDWSQREKIFGAKSGYVRNTL